MFKASTVKHVAPDESKSQTTPKTTTANVVAQQQTPSTAFPPNNSMHPLENKWVMWYDYRVGLHQGQNAAFEDGLKLISEFSTVEEFWGVFNHIKRPSALEYGANYHMFKKGIKPMTEDPANVNGGRWMIILSSQDELSRLDKAWEHLLLSLLGEYLYDGLEAAFPQADSTVNGVVVSRRRKQTRIAIWTNEKKAESLLLALGRRIKEVCQAGDAQTEFDEHNKPEGSESKTLRI